MTAPAWHLASERGFSLFPLGANSKRPSVEKWEAFQSAPPSPSLIAEWSSWHSNMAVATGAVSGVVVLDCDTLLARMEAEGRGIPPTFSVATPRGTHFYFQHPGWPVTNHAGRRWTSPDNPAQQVEGLDLRADGGYVVGPGSHYVPSPEEAAKGKVAGAYRIECDAPVAPAPEWLLELIRPRDRKAPVARKFAEETSAYGRKCLTDELLVLQSAPHGSINDQVNASAFALGQLVAGGEIEADEALEALRTALEIMGLADEEKALGTLERGYEAGLEVPRGVEHVEPFNALAVLGPRATQQPLPDVADRPIPQAPAVALRPVAASLVPADKPRYVNGNNMYDYFRGCVYVAEEDKVFTPAGVLVAKSAFDALYGGPRFVIDLEGEGKPSKSAWEMFRLSEHGELAKVWKTCFKPLKPAGEIIDLEGLPFLNTYVPINVPRREGDPSPFVNHVRRMLPDGDDADIVLHWMASAVQNPGVKFQWWPVIQGAKGGGKTMLLETMVRAIGERYSHLVRADSVLKTGNQFNDWIVGKLFLGFEEIKSSEGKRDFVEAMKDSVTNARLATEAKGGKQGTSDNCANGMMLTNHNDACPIDDDERRWGIFYCAQQTYADLIRDGMDGPYFRKLYDWLREEGYAIVSNFLATMPLQDALDPARGLMRAPITTSTDAAKSLSLGLIEQEILDAIESGLSGFRGGVITSTAIRHLFERMRKTIAPRRYRKIMDAVGYVAHPLLDSNKGRPNNAMYDGDKPVLYYAKGSDLLGAGSAAELLARTEAILRGEEGIGTNVVPMRK